MSEFYEGVVYENQTLRASWSRKEAFPPQGLYERIVEPVGLKTSVPPEVYNGHRKGRDSACVDIVIATRLPDGTPAVLLSLRKSNVCFPGKWWIYGGALQAYVSIEEFISGRATKECGVPVRPEAVIGTYRTIDVESGECASTLQVCYATYVPYDVIKTKMAMDDNHDNVRLFTEKTLPTPSDDEFHWYPNHVARRALLNIPSESTYSRYSPPDRDILFSDPTN